MVKIVALFVLFIAWRPAFGAELDAREAFDEGRRYFAAGRYDEALLHLEDAYRLSDGRPSATLALAQCHRALGNTDLAIRFFSEYLQAAPNAPDRASVQKTIEVLERDRPPTVSPTPTPPPPPSAPDPFDVNVRREPPPAITSTATIITEPVEPSGISAWWWVVGGIVLVGAAAAAVAVASSGDPEPVGGSLGRTIRL